MRILLSILLLSICLSDEYPYFSEPSKQFKFELKRIYIKEESGERTITSGGGSYIDLANPFGAILGANPQYVSVDKPINTIIEYWYDFSITQNNIQLTEIDMLKAVGLNNEAINIINDYNIRVIKYNEYV